MSATKSKNALKSSSNLKNEEVDEFKKSRKSINLFQKKQEELINNQEINAVNYQEKIEDNSGVPHYMMDMLDISQKARIQYEDLVLKLKVIDIMLCIICSIIIFCAYYDNELISKNFVFYVNEFQDTNLNLKYRIAIIVLNIISVLLIMTRYKFMIDVHKLKLGKIANRDNIITTKYIYYLLAEILVNIMFIPPIFEKYYSMKGVVYNYSYSINPNNLFWSNITVNANQTLNSYASVPSQEYISQPLTIILTYTVSSVMTFFCLIRFYHFARAIYTFSYWTSPRTYTICKVMNTKPDVTFALKAYLKIKPFISLIIGVILIIGVFGVGIKAFENYNENLVNLISLDNNSPGSVHGKIMRKFTNIYNSYWLILVTMTTIGYGDIYPTTYFGRVLAILACICGTFILSLLIVFLNKYITFDEVEKAIYNQVMDEEVRLTVIKNDAIRVVWNFLKLNYLRKMHKNNSAISRFSIYLDLKYLTKRFKIIRLNSLKKDVDIEEILNGIKFDIDNGIDPIKREIESYNKERILNDDSFNNLKLSNELCDSFFKNSMQMWNLTRVLNKGKCLDGLMNINEVYDSQVNLLDEIIYYHKFSNKNGEMNSFSESNSEIEKSNNNEEDKIEIDNKIHKDSSFDFNIFTKNK